MKKQKLLFMQNVPGASNLNPGQTQKKKRRKRFRATIFRALFKALEVLLLLLELGSAIIEFFGKRG